MSLEKSCDLSDDPHRLGFDIGFACVEIDIKGHEAVFVQCIVHGICGHFLGHWCYFENDQFMGAPLVEDLKRNSGFLSFFGHLECTSSLIIVKGHSSDIFYCIAVIAADLQEAWLW